MCIYIYINERGMMASTFLTGKGRGVEWSGVAWRGVAWHVIDHIGLGFVSLYVA